MECTINWMGADGMAFVAETGSGHMLTMEKPEAVNAALLALSALTPAAPADSLGAPRTS